MSKTAVLVVHGVGETEPGATVDALMAALATTHPDIQQDGAPKVLWFPDPPPPGTHWSTPDSSDAAKNSPIAQPNDPHFGKVFPVHARSVTLNGLPYEFFEVYWADLSRVRDGWLNLLVGLFYFIFDVRHLARAAADQQKGWGAPCMRWVVTCVGELLLRVVAPITAFLGLTVTACALLAQVGFKLEQLTQNSEWIMGGLGLAALCLGFFWAIILRTRSEPWTWFCSSGALTGLCVLALAVMVGVRETYGEVIIPMLLTAVVAFYHWRRSAASHPFRNAFLIGGGAIVKCCGWPAGSGGVGLFHPIDKPYPGDDLRKQR